MSGATVKGLKQTPSLAEMTTRFLAGGASANDVARAFLTDVRVKNTIVSSALWKGQQSVIDELVQDTLILFNEKYLAVPGALKLPDPDSVYSLVFALGDHAGLTKRRELEQNKPGVISMDDTIGSNGEYEEQNYSFMEIDDDFEDNRLTELDVERAGRELERRLMSGQSAISRIVSNILETKEKELMAKAKDALANGPSPGFVPKGLGAPRPLKNVTESRLTPEQRRIKEIRAEIGMTLEDYAKALSIGIASLSAYIYGRTDSVPRDVVDTAEQLLREHKDRFDNQRMRYDGRTMEQILDDWCTELGIVRDEGEHWVTIMADITGVKPVTVRRWVSEKYRPTVLSLINYGLAVDQWVAKNGKVRAEKSAGRRRGASTPEPVEKA